MAAPEPGNLSHGYKLPESRILERAEERALAIRIQDGIARIEAQLFPRLDACLTAIYPEHSHRLKLAPIARRGLKRAIVAHAGMAAKDADGLHDKLARELGRTCKEKDLHELQEKVQLHFSLSNDELTRLSMELAAINEAATQFVASNMALVMAISHGFATSRIPRADLCQEGVLALRKAALAYLPTHGTKFGTYATPAIQNRFKDICRGCNGVTDYAARHLEEFAAARETLTADLARTPLNEEVFEFLQWPDSTRESVSGALKLAGASQTSSDDDGNPVDISDSHGFEPWVILANQEAKAKVAEAFMTLTNEEKRVVTKHVFQHQSIHSIALEDGLKTDYPILKIYASATAKLTKALSPLNTEREGSDPK